MNNMQVHVCVYVRMSDCVCVCVECVFMYVCGSVLRVYSFMCVGLCVHACVCAVCVFMHVVGVVFVCYVLMNVCVHECVVVFMNLCVCTHPPFVGILLLFQPPPQQTCDGGEAVAHPVDVSAAAPQDGSVSLRQAPHLQQQAVVQAVLHAAQQGHQVGQGAACLGLGGGGGWRQVNPCVIFGSLHNLVISPKIYTPLALANFEPW